MHQLSEFQLSFDIPIVTERSISSISVLMSSSSTAVLLPTI